MKINNIYTYIEENFNIKITDYQFKRDYIKNPLKRGEKPYKEDLEYLYLTLNLSTKDLSKLFNICHTSSKKIIHFYNINKTKDMKIFSGKEKYKQTCLKKYGTEYVLSSPIIRSKITKTNALKTIEEKQLIKEKQVKTNAFKTNEEKQ